MAGFSTILLSILGGGILLTFIGVCFVQGLFFISDLIEEFPKKSKLGFKILIGINMSILLLLAVTDNFPKFACLFTFSTNFLYLYALKKIPTLEVETFEIIATCATTLINHFLWFYEIFLYHQRPYNHPLTHLTVWEMLCFFIILIWLVPIGLLLSCTTPLTSLPSTNPHIRAKSKEGRVSLSQQFRSLFSSDASDRPKAY